MSTSFFRPSPFLGSMVLTFLTLPLITSLSWSLFAGHPELPFKFVELWSTKPIGHLIIFIDVLHFNFFSKCNFVWWNDDALSHASCLNVIEDSLPVVLVMDCHKLIVVAQDPQVTLSTTYILVLLCCYGHLFILFSTLDRATISCLFLCLRD